MGLLKKVGKAMKKISNPLGIKVVDKLQNKVSSVLGSKLGNIAGVGEAKKPVANVPYSGAGGAYIGDDGVYRSTWIPPEMLMDPFAAAGIERQGVPQPPSPVMLMNPFTARDKGT